MRKTERQELLMTIGIIFLLVGMFLIYDSVTRVLVLIAENVATRVFEFIGGAFLIIIGAWLCAWGYSDEAGKDASKFLKAIFDRLLKGLRR
jgi:arginine exporter protein ArgO